MVIADHLNLTGKSPLIGRNADELGPRFPDLTDVWTPALRQRLHAAGAAEGVELEEGIYAGLLGPSYETPAEVRMLRTLGADAVGMSTVLEAVAARWAGLEVCGVSLVTNAGAGYSGQPLTHAEVMEAGEVAGPRLAQVCGGSWPTCRPRDRQGSAPEQAASAPERAGAPDERGRAAPPRLQGPFRRAVEEDAEDQDPHEDADEQQAKTVVARHRPTEARQPRHRGGDEQGDPDKRDPVLAHRTD